MDLGSILLNGIFGLIFAIIGYKAIIRGAKIEAEATQRAVHKDVSRPGEEVINRPSPRVQTTLVQMDEFSLDQIHWSWWLTYLIIGFCLVLFVNLWAQQEGFTFMLIFILFGIPILSFRQAYKHPLSWMIALAYITTVYVAVFIFAVSTHPSLYSDLYVDFPLWAWTFGNIGGVAIISILQKHRS